MIIHALMGSIRRRGALGLMAGACALTTACAEEAPAPAPALKTSAPHWTYAGEDGPEHWGELSADFAACKTGRNQSPIDLKDPTEAALAPLGIHYDGATTQVVNNGHTVQINLGPKNWLDVEGSRFTALQIHFHAPSEHRVRGDSFPIEAHIVHRSEAGELAVLGVLFREGVPDTHLDSIWTTLPARAGDTTVVALPLSELRLLPANTSYFRYSGSLTTPPCTEGVRWFVLEDVKSMSPGQIAAFTRIAGMNARPPLPLYARQLLHTR